MTFISELIFDHSQRQVSRVKQGTLTPPDHILPDPVR